MTPWLWNLAVKISLWFKNSDVSKLLYQKSLLIDWSYHCAELGQTSQVHRVLLFWSVILDFTYQSQQRILGGSLKIFTVLCLCVCFTVICHRSPSAVQHWGVKTSQRAFPQIAGPACCQNHRSFGPSYHRRCQTDCPSLSLCWGRRSRTRVCGNVHFCVTSI